ncbi:MAG: chloride channel protein [Gammaproteobacteria bacterium]|nr:chloride channel protein [Gammaproteobacteria bacterium]
MSAMHPAGRYMATTEWRRRLVFWGGAVATGAVAVLFALGSEAAMSVFRRACGSWHWWPLVATPAGLALCVWITQRWFPGSEGSGIPQTIAALGLATETERDRVLGLRIAFGKILVTLAALASGASIGREGPSVQVGASIMHSLRRFARFPAVDVDRGLILAGGAAGVAAAFNTPLAGVVFAIEELSRSFEERTSGVILMAVILAGATAIALVGDYTYFGSTSTSPTGVATLAAAALCGVCGGLLGGAFSRAMLSARMRLPAPLRRLSSTRPVLFAATCGVLLAAIGFLSDGTTFGTGYVEARGILQEGAYPAPAFALLKALATIVSYLTGIPGGIFAPSLAVGAGIGGELHAWFPIAPAGSVVVLSMAAYFAGVVQAPLTALVIVLEMTNDRALMLPLMAAVLVGRAASAVVCREPLYRSLAQRFLPGDRGQSARDD